MNAMKLFKYLAMMTAVMSALEEVKSVLTLLAKDDYEGAAAALLAIPSLAADLEKLPAEAQAAAPLLLPVLLEALDRVLPEEKILGVLG